jgi:enoyl-CoA hydratase
MADSTILVDREAAVALITLNRPSVHNALNAQLLRTLVATLDDLVAGPGTRAIVLTGAGDRAFSAGADLDELAGLDASAAHQVLSAGQSIMARIEASPVPVIAAVNGLALGGGLELALSATFPIMSTSASVGLPESGLGLIPGYGGTQRLPRAVGPAVAAHMMLTGSRLSAARAYTLGLTPLEPVAPEALVATATQIAAEIAGRGPRAHAAILQALHAGAPRSQDLALETALAAVATAGAEAAEGISAFRERRTPVFGGDSGGSASP